MPEGLSLENNSVQKGIAALLESYRLSSEVNDTLMPKGLVLNDIPVHGAASASRDLFTTANNRTSIAALLEDHRLSSEVNDTVHEAASASRGLIAAADPGDSDVLGGSGGALTPAQIVALTSKFGLLLVYLTKTGYQFYSTVKKCDGAIEEVKKQACFAKAIGIAGYLTSTVKTTLSIARTFLYPKGPKCSKAITGLMTSVFAISYDLLKVNDYCFASYPKNDTRKEPHPLQSAVVFASRPELAIDVAANDAVGTEVETATPASTRTAQRRMTYRHRSAKKGKRLKEWTSSSDGKTDSKGHQLRLRATPSNPASGWEGDGGSDF